MKRKIKFVVEAARWSDRINTYHAVRIVRCSDGAELRCPLQYGYGDHYRQTALQAMARTRWLPVKYRGEPWLYERENGYPIEWIVCDTTKRAAKALGGG